MNELERLIAHVDRPDPTGWLDARINAVIQSRVTSNKRRRQNEVVACGVAACIGILGFFVGRQSVSTAADTSSPMTIATTRDPANEGTLLVTNVTNVPLADDQLAGLFVRRHQREGLLGAGPVTILTSTSP
jgi:hypothetical protein